jgi:hypothetical protein
VKPVLTFCKRIMLSRLALIFLVSLPAAAQKLHVKVLAHTVDGKSVMRVVPGVNLSSGNANANCAAYGNSANCSSGASGNTVSIPARTQEVTMAHIQMLLLLPDGRRVGVYCNDHARPGAPLYTHYCKNPEVDEFEANFSGDKVKLTWGVGLDGKKKVSEAYVVGPVYPAPTEPTDPPKP